MNALFAKVKSLASNRDAVPRGTTDGLSHVEGVPDELAIEVDANGSPITEAASHWFVCFVPGLQKQWWHRFANAKHKHVFAMRAVDENTWILVEPWWTRMMIDVLTLDEAVKFLRWGAAGDILKVREAIPGKGSQSRGWSNCAVLMSFLLGRSYWTWTPHGLYRRLAAEANVEAVDLSRFLVEHLKSVADKNVDNALRGHSERSTDRFDDRLDTAGVGLMSAALSDSVVALYKVVISESSRFGEAADAYRTSGPKRAIASIEELLVEAKRRGEIDVDDCEMAARQFGEMLRGEYLSQIIFGIRKTPNPLEIHTHVRSVVRVFLQGALFADRHAPGVAVTGGAAARASRAIDLA